MILNDKVYARIALAGVGLAAAVALGVLSSGSPSTGGVTIRAGSGDAPTNTTYTQPGVSAMNTGASATFTTPGSELATSVAKPAIKAGG